jgi:hypothetical protein
LTSKTLPQDHPLPEARRRVCRQTPAADISNVILSGLRTEMEAYESCGMNITGVIWVGSDLQVFVPRGHGRAHHRWEWHEHAGVHLSMTHKCCTSAENRLDYLKDPQRQLSPWHPCPVKDRLVKSVHLQRKTNAATGRSGVGKDGCA